MKPILSQNDIMILPVRNSMEFSPANQKCLSIYSHSLPGHIHCGAHRFPYKLHRLPKGRILTKTVFDST